MRLPKRHVISKLFVDIFQLFVDTFQLFIYISQLFIDIIKLLIYISQLFVDIFQLFVDIYQLFIYFFLFSGTWTVLKITSMMSTLMSVQVCYNLGPNCAFPRPFP